jgi:REP element-mobilizing transposase RayT
MPQSLARIIVHMIFSTKSREPFITAEMCPELSAYLGGIAKNLDCYPIKVNCPTDHAHTVFVLSKTRSLVEIIREAKRTSTKWVKSRWPTARKFGWQNGYGAFSVSESQLEAVIRYVENQQEHHRKVTFQDEFREFLKRHRIDFDERYVWD